MIFPLPSAQAQFLRSAYTLPPIRLLISSNRPARFLAPATHIPGPRLRHSQRHALLPSIPTTHTGAPRRRPCLASFSLHRTAPRAAPLLLADPDAVEFDAPPPPPPRPRAHFLFKPPGHLCPSRPSVRLDDCPPATGRCLFHAADAALYDPRRAAVRVLCPHLRITYIHINNARRRWMPRPCALCLTIRQFAVAAARSACVECARTPWGCAVCKLLLCESTYAINIR